mmetsp:Transcript_93178/g.266303  ORF Transcript_93178/g.266303 Transcript_93178/m.266303 type:complete len:811 (-) Transcript_93178:1173-3605(-)|eukprot:CAMPEP_0119522390 /NCGR_PEP_ID=MMETSP1344-20130328/37775_1 /TAXON_ID=236787 /ORGANISM="Florenciella parvula, Strain CCMP2471" /LENGTH=810 /DNA_ID=CAMNT_0007560425 /DNA_START=398 /DNA_END=2830 /DNA_ORIENTATION=-
MSHAAQLHGGNNEPPKLHAKKIGFPEKNIRELDRRSKDKNRFIHDGLHFKLLDAQGHLREGCEWTIPRMKLSPKLLQELISRCPIPGKLDYVQEDISQQVFFPADMQLQCKPEPYAYRVCLRTIRIAEDIVDDPHFSGYMQIIIRGVPPVTDKADNEVMANDLKTWVLYGLKEEHPQVKEAADKLQRTKNEIERLKRTMRQIPRTDPRGEGGKKLKGKEADAERADMRRQALEEKDHLEIQLEKAQQHLDDCVDGLKTIPLHLEKVVDDNEGAGTGVVRNTCTWNITFDEDHEEDHDHEYDPELALVKKNDWDGIKLCVGWADDVQEYEPWAGRGNIPSGGKPYIPDYSHYAVNMKGIRIMRVQHGIGMHKMLNKRGIDFYGPKFSVYHGEWKEGVRHGYGQRYDDSGIYSGYWVQDRIRGKGTMDYPHGSAFKGKFEVTRYHVDKGYHFEPLAENPYADGIPNDAHGLYQFPDGSAYEGSVIDGRITGMGVYENAMGEKWKGSFRNGLLHGQGTHTDVLGNTWTGTWKDGMLFGDGEYTGANKERYKGTYIDNEFHGWGFQRYRNGNQSKGFYLRNDRNGHGTVIHGHVREKWNKHTLSTDFTYRRIYDGLWLAGKPTGRGADTYAQSGNVYYVANSGDEGKDSRAKFIENVKEIEDKANKKRAVLMAKYAKLDLYVRRSLVKKKKKIFGQARHAAKEALLNDAVEPYTNREVEGSINLRQNTVAKIIEQGRVTEDEADRLIDNNPITLGAMEVEKVNEWDFKPKVIDVLQSDFEEAEERRRFLNDRAFIEKAKRKIRMEELAENDKSK